MSNIKQRLDRLEQSTGTKGLVVIYKWDGVLYDGPPFSEGARVLSAEEVAALERDNYVIQIGYINDWRSEDGH